LPHRTNSISLPHLGAVFHYLLAHRKTFPPSTLPRRRTEFFLGERFDCQQLPIIFGLLIPKSFIATRIDSLLTAAVIACINAT
jgi:hypothetical protein